jgi:hypothetical protein
MCQSFCLVANSPHLHHLPGVVQTSTLADHHLQVSAGRLRLHRDAARLLQATTGPVEMLTLTDREAFRGRGLPDDIELALDLFPPALAPHRGDEAGGARVQVEMLVPGGEGAGAIAAIAVMVIEVEVEVVVMVEGAGAEIVVVS